MVGLVQDILYQKGSVGRLFQEFSDLDDQRCHVWRLETQVDEEWRVAAVLDVALYPLDTMEV